MRATITSGCLNRFRRNRMPKCFRTESTGTPPIFERRLNFPTKEEVRKPSNARASATTMKNGIPDPTTLQRRTVVVAEPHTKLQNKSNKGRPAKTTQSQYFSTPIRRIPATNFPQHRSQRPPSTRRSKRAQVHVHTDARTHARTGTTRATRRTHVRKRVQARGSKVAAAFLAPTRQAKPIVRAAQPTPRDVVLQQSAQMTSHIACDGRESPYSGGYSWQPS